MNILLCDPRTLFRTGLARMLDREDDFEVVASVSTIRFAIEVACSVKPSIVIASARLPDGDVHELAQQLWRVTKPIRILAIPSDIGANLDPGPAVEATVPLPATFDLLVEVLRDPSGVAALDQFPPPQSAQLPDANSADPNLGLRDRDWRLLELVASGLSNVRVARILGIHEKTVRNRLTGLYELLGVRSRTEAAVEIHRSGSMPIKPPS